MSTVIMSRLAGRTYSRTRKEDSASKAFDEAVLGKPSLSTRATSTIQRWGKTSFTSSRDAGREANTESDKRKRRVDVVVEDGFGDDPFSFEHEDEGPSKPKRGMGYKLLVKGSEAASEVAAEKAVSVGKPISEDTFSVSVKSKRTNSYEVKCKTVTENKKKEKPVLVSNTLHVDSSSEKDRRAKATNNNVIAVDEGGGDLKTSLKICLKNHNVNSCNGSISILTKPKVAKADCNQASILSFVSKAPQEIDDRKKVRGSRGAESKPAARKFFVTRGDRVPHKEDDSLDAGNVKQTPRDDVFTAVNSCESNSSNDCDVDFSDSYGATKTVHSPKRNLTSIAKSDVRIAPVADSPDAPLSEIDEFVDDMDSDPDISFNSSRTNKAEESSRKVRTATNRCELELTVKDLQVGKKNPSLEKVESEPCLKEVASLKVRLKTCKSFGDDAALTERSDLKSVAKNSDVGHSKPATRRLLSGSLAQSSVRGKAVYNHRQWNAAGDDEEIQPAVGGQESVPTGSKAPKSKDAYDELDDEPTKSVPYVSRAQLKPSSSVGSAGTSASAAAAAAAAAAGKFSVDRRHKQLFTVVHNVKQAHEVQEYGETQEFKDDIDYIMEGLPSSKSVTSRCLTTISLVMKCTTPGFRMHLRAHGTLTKVFSALSDAPQHPTLALCTAAIFFMVSHDRITLELDEDGLELMIRLLGADAITSDDSRGASASVAIKDYLQIQSKLQDVFHSFNSRGKVQRIVLPLSEVTAGHLAMEALLRLTSKRDGNWFKEELRKLGGLDHIVRTVERCVARLEEDDDAVELSPVMLGALTKLEHCFRVLENVTYMNSSNQNHVVSYQSGALVKAAHRCIQFCERCLPHNGITCVGDKVNKSCPGYVAFSCLLATFRVLLNLSHENSSGSDVIGQLDGLLKSVLACILPLPRCLPASERFDLLVLGLGLLINLVEHSKLSLRLLLNTRTIAPFDQYPSISGRLNALNALVMLFNLRYEAAKMIEEEHDAELEEKERQRQETLAGRDFGNMDGRMSPDVSGTWHESESSMHWVASDAYSATSGRDGAVAVRKKKDSASVWSDDCSSAADVYMPNSGGNVGASSLGGSQTDEENLTKALHKAGKHMEDSIVAAYVSLLVGTVILHCPHLSVDVRALLPDSSFEPMTRMLRKFLGFMNFTNDSCASGSKSIRNILEVLESC